MYNNAVLKEFQDRHWPWPSTEDEGDDVAEDVWQETRRRRAGKLAGEDTEMPDRLFRGNPVDRGSLRPEEKEREEERGTFSDAIGEQWQDIAAIPVGRIANLVRAFFSDTKRGFMFLPGFFKKKQMIKITNYVFISCSKFTWLTFIFYF